MRRLAREVGVTAPALYRHFEGKEEVLVAVVGEAYKVLVEYLYRALGEETPAERFRMAGEAYLDFALDHPRYYETMHAPLEAIGIEEVPDDLQARICGVRQFWDDRLREAMAAGIIEPADPGEIGPTMWAHAHGLISLYLRGMLPEELDDEAFRALYRKSSRNVMDGIGTRAWRSIYGFEEEGRESLEGPDSETLEGPGSVGNGVGPETEEPKGGVPEDEEVGEGAER